MAKRKKVNKTQEVTKYLAAHPGAKPGEVVEALKQYNVSPTYVSNIKSALKGKRSKKRRGGKKRASTKTATAGGNSVIAAAELISICGSAEEALRALKTAEKVASVLDR